MAITQVLRKLGQWDVRLRDDAPPGIVASLDYLGHIAVVAGRVNPVELGDQMRTMARYVGVFRRVNTKNQTTLSGSGMAYWLGDESGVGDLIESPGVVLAGATFSDSVRALLPAGGAVTEGTLTNVSGLYTNTHTWQTPRAALDYLCDYYGADWRVNGDGTADAGPASALFRATPEAIIARREISGYDMSARALAGEVETDRDVSAYTTKVIVVADGYHIGDATAATIPYSDPHGNPVALTRVADEQDDTLAVNADARAQMILDKYATVRRQVRLSVDDFDVAGDVEPGDVVWVWDPDAGLYDPANEVPFRGQLLQPAAVRVLALTWPVTEGYTVGFRHGDGHWTDLTPWVEWEQPSGGEVEVADSLSVPLTSSLGSLGTQVSGGGGGAGDTSIPGVPVFGTFIGTSYQPADGLPRAAVQVTWSQPLNTDGSTIVDGDHYEVRYRPTGTTGWEVVYAAWSSSSLTVSNLPPSTGYDWQIRAVDYAAPVNEGAWSATTTYSTPADTTAPDTPAPPSVAASLIAVQVTHTLGKATGGTYNLPLDMDHFEVHVDTSSGFTPSAASLVGKLRATSVELAGSIPVVGTFQIDTLVGAGVAAFVKVVAVDRTGNRSTASSAATATAQLIDSAHITSLTASKITAGSITAAVVIGGSATFSGALSAATGTFVGALSAVTGTFAGTLSGATGTFTGQVSTGTSGRRVTLNPAGTIDLVGSLGNTGGLSVNSFGEAVLSAGSGSISISSAQCSISTSMTCGALSSSSGFFTGSVSASSFSTSGSVASGSLSTGSISASGGSWAGVVSVGSAGNQTSIQGSTVLFGNITFTGATGVAANFNGRFLQGVSSTRASKAGITDAEATPADALRLRPVSFYARAQDGTPDLAARHFGFIAEDVAAVPALRPLVVCRDDGDVVGIGYDRIPAVQQVLLLDHEARILALAHRMDVIEGTTT